MNYLLCFKYTDKGHVKYGTVVIPGAAMTPDNDITTQLAHIKQAWALPEDTKISLRSFHELTPPERLLRPRPPYPYLITFIYSRSNGLTGSGEAQAFSTKPIAASEVIGFVENYIPGMDQWDSFGITSFTPLLYVSAELRARLGLSEEVNYW